MACGDMRLTPQQTQAQREAQIKAALKRLEDALRDKAIKIEINKLTGAFTFKGWQKDEDRASISDACAFRRLTAENSFELRMAVMRAEVASGRKINVNSGTHSHDGGATWDPNH